MYCLLGGVELHRVAAARLAVGPRGVLDDVRRDLGHRGLQRETPRDVVDAQPVPPHGEAVLDGVEALGHGGDVERGHRGPPEVVDSCSDWTVPGPRYSTARMTMLKMNRSKTTHAVLTSGAMPDACPVR